MAHPPEPAVLAAGVAWFQGWKWNGNFTTLDLIAAGTNALNGALLARWSYSRTSTTPPYGLSARRPQLRQRHFKSPGPRILLGAPDPDLESWRRGRP